MKANLRVIKFTLLVCILIVVGAAEGNVDAMNQDEGTESASLEDAKVQDLNDENLKVKDHEPENEKTENADALQNMSQDEGQSGNQDEKSEELQSSSNSDIGGLLKRYLPEKEGIEALAALEKDLDQAIVSASSTEDRVLNLERMLKVKDAQLDDARTVAKYYMEALEDTDGKAERLRSVIRQGKLGNAELAERLNAEMMEEEDLKQRLVVEEQQLAALQRNLKESQIDADDPTLSRWMQKRIEDLGAMIDDAPTGRELGKVVGHAVDEARESVQSFEASVEKRIMSPVIAIVICILVLLAPSATLMWAVSRLTKAISYRQHILLGHIFNAGFLLVCILITLVTGLDPLVTMRHVSPQYSLIIIVFFCIQWPTMLFLILHSVFFSSDTRERQSFASHLLLFVAVCLHASKDAHTRMVHGIARLSLSQSNFKNYSLYLISTAAMILLTVSAAEARNEGLVLDVKNIVHDGVGNVEDAMQKAFGEQSLKMKSNLGKSRGLSLTQTLTENDIDKME